MKTAAQLMTPQVKFLQSGDSLQEAARTFLTNSISSCPVVNAMGQVQGVLTENGLLQAHMAYRAAIQKRDPRLMKSDKIGNFLDLLEPVVYVDHNAPMNDVVKLLFSSPTRRILVRDPFRKIVGIVSPKDLLRTISGIEYSVENLKEKLAEAETQLKEALARSEELRADLGRFERVFHEIPYLIYAVDDQEQIIMANRRVSDFLGFSSSELVGKTLSSIHTDAARGEARRALREVVEKGSHRVGYTTLLSKAGVTVRCEVASSSIRDADGKFVSAISVLRPVDSDQMLRALNGRLKGDEGGLSRYALVVNEDTDKA